MAFTTTKTDWSEEVLNAPELNRIEENIQGNHDDIVTNAGTISANIDQPVKTTSNVTFNDLTVTGDITNLLPAGRSIHQTTITRDEVFNILSPYIPNIGDEMKITGGLDFPGGGSVMLPSKMGRIDAVTIWIYTHTLGLSGAYQVVSGSMSNMSLSIAW